MITRAGSVCCVLAVVTLLAAGVASAAGSEKLVRWTPREVEDYVHVPTPDGIHVEHSELDGAVFADARGHTLYSWHYIVMFASAVTGDPPGESTCGSEKHAESVAHMVEPYPAGLLEPDLEERQSCAERWPAALVKAGAKPVGDWTIITRKDGTKQWAYKKYPLYTSIFDRTPGDVMGGRRTVYYLNAPPERIPVGPPARMPPGFLVITMPLGRMLVNDLHMSVYSSDRDGKNKSNCDEVCAQTWIPIVAPEAAQAQGEWSLVERAPGVRQWAFRGKPLYINSDEHNQFDYGSIWSLDGSDNPGWHNVYLQTAPPPPKEFTVQTTLDGYVLADATGKTLYYYSCADNTRDQLSCDHPLTTQVYRFAICGAGSAERCLRTWQYVVASPSAKVESRTWSIVAIDPMTGKYATPGQAGALRVWAYRDRPVYTYVGDHAAGDFFGAGFGENSGKRNGFQAMFRRDKFLNYLGREALP